MRWNRTTPDFVAPRTSDSDPVIECYKKDVDRSLLRENLKLTVEQRLVQLMKLQEFHDELRRAGRQANWPT